MNFEEFLEPEELDVQKAVVESLAEDKAKQDEQISNLRAEIVSLKSKVAQLENQLKLKTEEVTTAAERLLQNSEPTLSNKVTLLERNLELEDRFEGESHDQIIEVLKEARDKAEKDGRLRRAQIIESVLVANESSGQLIKHHNDLVKLFNENQNILSGYVIERLKQLGISHKNGEQYLLPSEIIKRNF